MSGHGHGTHGEHGTSEENKRVALVISVLALLLAVAEILGQKAQTQTLQANIEASNLWAFFQAKTVRKAISETAADEMEVMSAAVSDPAQKKMMQDRIARWRAATERMESEPGDGKKPGEGRKELRERAAAAEALRDKAGKKHYRFELATGSFQIAIVLASAMVITGFAGLLYGAFGLGALGLCFLLAGLTG